MLPSWSLLALAAVFAPAVPASAADFGPAVTYSGYEPVGIAAADLNHDGAVDVATADNDETTSGLGIRLGDGHGALGAVARFGAGARSYGVALADFGGDGVLDVAVSNCLSNDVSVLHGRGDGSFDPPVDLPAGACPADVVAGDLNGDGAPDLVTVDNNSPGVTVLLNARNGGFQPGRTFTTGATHPQMGVLADLDGDGHLDVATPADGNPDDAIAVLWGAGDGTFSAPTIVQTPGVAGNQPRGIAAGDLNRDGRLDLVTAGGTGVGVLLRAGGRSFAAAQAYPAYPGTPPSADAHGVALLDANGDHALVAVADGSTSDTPGGLTLLHGDGSGRLAPPEFYALPPAELNDRTRAEGADAQDVVATDLNGDRRPDLAVSHGLYGYDDGGVAVLLNSGTWDPGTAAGNAPQSASLVHVRALRARRGWLRLHVWHPARLHGRTTVALRRRGPHHRWHVLARSGHASFRLRRRVAAGRYLVRASFRGSQRTLAVRIRAPQRR